MDGMQKRPRHGEFAVPVGARELRGERENRNSRATRGRAGPRNGGLTRGSCFVLAETCCCWSRASRAINARGAARPRRSAARPARHGSGRRMPAPGRCRRGDERVPARRVPAAERGALHYGAGMSWPAMSGARRSPRRDSFQRPQRGGSAKGVRCDHCEVPPIRRRPAERACAERSRLATDRPATDRLASERPANDLRAVRRGP